ncbi:MAG: prepilin-type N-terminal cleavage/methylation domain-containing protein [Candidatus Omnitrophica bacterium]|nr:prepilin-type N-terminal cleavage/methylation domain-containing protein [Candidatus Omnitrophota bacterium]MCA9416484.1 prepilin-type N-terminal cleavage/methylation domain-containing protein [Candidatus Omnitrophota bacterium]MCA9426466.1 prepilin-type N-terminal cleavage/methylation domain-containing protein [Candidatus Omnitrophota bacterium]MCA9436043.1 prepilin-type N-terminal cleavage/methylation domain-containing protein [Candidatus Omnitrophota bacterium]MCA9441767.1 prepilin-type N-
MKRFRPFLATPKTGNRGFSLIEILVAFVILTSGLLVLLQILNRTLQQSEPIEFETRAALIAQTILESIRSDPTGMPFIPGLNPTTWPVVQDSSIYATEEYLLADQNGDPFDLRVDGGNVHRWNLPLIFSVPGNGVDDDAYEESNRGRLGQANGPWVDSRPLPDGDGIDDIMFDALRSAGRINTAPGVVSRRDFDGSIESDVSRLFLNHPQPRLDNDDTDGDGLIDDTGDSGSTFARLQGVLQDLGLRPDGDLTYDPQRGIDEEFADGEDNDGDGLTDEDLSLPSQVSLDHQSEEDINPYRYAPLLAGNGLDDDIDSATDEEIFDGLDNDGDGLIDEDCQGAVFPWRPAPLPFPNDEYNFQISVRRVPVAGDGIDNDGDANIRSGIPGYENITGLAIDEEFFNNLDDDGDDFIDEDVRAYAARGALYVTITIFQGDDRQDNDGDGWIDEEAYDDVDDDLDGSADEDTYKRAFRTTALVRLPEER